MALVCPVDLEEAGLVTNGVDRVPTTALASIFAITDQSEHTLTAIVGGHHQRRRADDETITEGCQYELPSISSALIDG